MYYVIQCFIREIPLTSLTSQSSHHFHLISSPYCHCTALSRHPVQLQYRHFPVYLISLYTFELFTEFLWLRSPMVRARDTDMQGSWLLTLLLSRRDVCTHWLRLLSSSFPPLTWLRLRWQQRESRHKTALLTIQVVSAAEPRLAMKSISWENNCLSLVEDLVC